MPKHDLSHMQYDEVSLVDFGANPPARVTLHKRADVAKSGPINQDDLGYEGDDEDNPSEAGKTARAKMLGKAAVTPAPTTDKGDTDDDSNGGTNVSGGTTGPSKQPTQTPSSTAKRRGGPIDATHLGYEVRDDDPDDADNDGDGDRVDAMPDDDAARSPHETGRLKGAVRYSKGAHSPMPRQSATDDLPEIVTKADLEQILKSYTEKLEKAEARAAAAEELARSEADKVAKRESIAKAQTWSHIPQLEPASFGETWLSLTKSNPEAVEVLEKIFDATEAALTTPASTGGSIYRATGRGTVGTSTAVAKGNDPMAPILQAASAIRKSDPSLSQQQAIVRVMQQQPELASAYRESMGFIPEGGYSE